MKTGRNQTQQFNISNLVDFYILPKQQKKFMFISFYPLILQDIHFQNITF